MIDEKDVIEVEVVDSTLDQKEPTKAAPQHVKSDKRNQVFLWAMVSSYCFRFGFPLALLGGFSGLAFSILYGETHGTFQLVLLIIAFSICGLGVFGSLFGVIARALMRHYMKLDPNFEDKL